MRTLENRIPPPIVLALVASLMWLAAPHLPHAHLANLSRFILAGGLIAIGALPALLAFRQFARAKTTSNPIDIQAASSLVTTGIYARTRNPMYVSLTALLLGWSFILNSPWLILGPAAFALFITRFQIIPEEHALTAKFGQAYVSYKARAPRWL